MTEHAVTLVVLALVLAHAVPAHATAPTPPRGLDAVLRRAVDHSPALKVAVLDLERARLAFEAEDARYVPSLSATVGYTHSASPSLNPGGTEVKGSDSVLLGVGVAHQFAFGTSLAADLELGGAGRRDLDPDVNESLRLGPGYEVSLRLSATQPLLRGLGLELGEADLRAARFTRDAATQARLGAASDVVRDVTVAYWELWYSKAAERIQAGALEVARRQLAEAEARAEAGRIPRLSVLPLRSEQASVEEGLVAADVSTQKRSVTLARLTGLSLPEASASVTGTPTTTDALPEATATVEAATANAFELAELEAAVEQARIGAAVAGHAVKPRLDARAWVTVAGLGNDDAVGAFEMLGTFGAVSGFVGLELGLPLDNTEARSGAARARLAVKVARERLRDARERLAEQAMQQHAELRSAVARLASAQKTARIAVEVATGQKLRFDNGAGTALELVTAEQDRRRAELRVERAKADVAIARMQLAHITGRALEGLALD